MAGTRMGTARLALVTAVALALAVPGPVHAGEVAGWTEPSRVSRSDDVESGPFVTTAPEGDVTVVWSNRRQVRSRTRQAGGPWGPVLRVGSGRVADVASDDAGNTTVLWTRWMKGQRAVLMVASRPDGGDWSAPRRLSRVPRVRGEYTIAWDPVLAVSPDGAAVAAWTYGSEHGGPRHRAEASYRPTGGSWGRSVRLAEPLSFTRDAEISPSGVPLVLVSDQGLRTLRRTDAGWSRFGGRITRRYESSALEVGPDGHAVVVWDRWPDRNSGPRSIVRASRLLDDGWRTPVRLTSPRRSGSSPRLGVDGSGAATVTWNSRKALKVSRWVAGRDPTAPSTVARRAGGEPAVAPGGAATIVGVVDRRRGVRILAVERPAGGTWSSRRRIATLHQDVYSADAAIWPGGRGVAAWLAEGRSSVGRAWVSWRR